MRADVPIIAVRRRRPTTALHGVLVGNRPSCRRRDGPCCRHAIFDADAHPAPRGKLQTAQQLALFCLEFGIGQDTFFVQIGEFFNQ